MTPAKYVTYIRESTNQHLEILIIRLTLTQLLCPMTLTFDPLTLKLVHGAGVPGTLPTKFGTRRPFRFPSRWRHGTDRQMDRINT